MSSLASAAQLARFHAARSTLYRAIAYLIGAPANERSRSIARGILGECPQPSLARDALEQALSSNMVLADSPSLADNPSLAERCETSSEEAERLSSLADRSARAIRQNDLNEAVRLADEQHNLIAGDAANDLRSLAVVLKKRSSDYTRHLGEAIELLVASDQQLLG